MITITVPNFNLPISIQDINDLDFALYWMVKELIKKFGKEKVIQVIEEIINDLENDEG